MIEKILERLEERRNDVVCMDDDDYFMGKSSAFGEAIEIVQEVAKEYGRNTNVRSNADRIRSMSDEELAGFLDEFDSVSGCDMCSVRGNCHAESNCIEGFLGWLKSETKE